MEEKKRRNRKTKYGKNINFRIPDDLMDLIDEYSADVNMSKSQFIRSAIEDKIKKLATQKIKKSTEFDL